MPTNEAIEHYFTSTDGLRLFYREYPALPESARLPVVCLSGLTRNSRDFDRIAPRLQRERRVLAPDLRGRGRSQHDPRWQNYHPGTYIADLNTLFDDARIDRFVLVGTSLGGILSMLLAGAYPQRVAGVVLNDVGPEVAPEGLARIAAYVGRHAPVSSWQDAVASVQATYGLAMPGLTDADWLEHAQRSYTELNGVPQLDMDPMIGEAVRSAPAAAAPDLWPLYAALRPIPTLALRGETSDILAVSTFERMQREKPDLIRVTVPQRGHAPLLDEPECVAALDAFMASVP
jgi:pimeloyl-ACP methyl ester carboxylesterase